MRISLNTSSMNNSQSLRYNGCCDKRPNFQRSASSKGQNRPVDYKKEFEKSQAQLDYLHKKYEVLCNVCALSLNPKFK